MTRTSIKYNKRNKIVNGTRSQRTIRFYLSLSISPIHEGERQKLRYIKQKAQAISIFVPLSYQLGLRERRSNSWRMRRTLVLVSSRSKTTFCTVTAEILVGITLVRIAAFRCLQRRQKREFSGQVCIKLYFVYLKQRHSKLSDLKSKKTITSITNKLATKSAV